MSAVRVALIGCGNIGTTHARAIAASGLVRCNALVDSDVGRADALRAVFFPDANVLPDTAEVPSVADAAVVATPAGLHAPISIALLRSGVHVLCEKPLATKLDDARAMVAAAHGASRILMCSLQRRFASTTRLVAEALEKDLVGAPVRAEVWESVSDWPLPKSSFDRAMAGGGAFFDVAPHLLDLFENWFGPIEILDYEDDAVRGVEAVGRARVACQGRYGSVLGTIHLSRGLRASNRCHITCTRGTIEVGGPDRDAIRLTFGHSTQAYLLKDCDPPRGAFDVQLEAFVRAITSGVDVVPIEAAVRTIALVEECYRVRRPLGSVYTEQSRPHARHDPPYRKVFLTGATGQIGARMVEIWASRGHLTHLRCLLGSYRNAAPILRYPAEIVEGNLLDRDALRKAVDGCDAIVHLGLGTHAHEEVQPLLEVAREKGIRRFVHMSSATVYGQAMPASIERLQEDTPLRRLGEPYADAKIGAERAVLGAVRGGLDAVILRPHIVYGPGQRWNTIMMGLLRDASFALVEDGGWCNLVYVDDLIDAVDLALVSTEGVGGAFFVTDGRPLLWRDFIQAHAALIGATLPTVRADEIRPRRFDGARRSMRRVAALAQSSELRTLILESALLREALVPAYRALKRTKSVGGAIARQPVEPGARAAAPKDHAWTALQLMEARLSDARAVSVLGYTPRILFAEGMVRTAAWLAFFGHLGADPSGATGDHRAVIVSPPGSSPS